MGRATFGRWPQPWRTDSRSANKKLLRNPFPVALGAQIPARPIMHWDPTLLLSAVVPILVHLIEHLTSYQFKDVADFAVMIIQRVIIRDLCVRHFRIYMVEIAQQGVHCWGQIVNIQAETASFAGGDWIRVGGIIVVQRAADS